MDIDKLVTYLATRGETAAVELLGLMEAKSQADEEYHSAMTAWLNEPETIALRDLAQSFGDYWKDLDFQNAVDCIDSATLHMQDGISLVIEAELKRARTCIVSLLNRFDDILGTDMHLGGQTPDWFVDAAAVSCGLVQREDGGGLKSGPATTRASLPDNQKLRKIGTEPVIIDASCYGPIPDVCLELGIWSDGGGVKWAKMEGEFHELLPGNRLKLSVQNGN